MKRPAIRLFNILGPECAAVAVALIFAVFGMLLMPNASGGDTDLIVTDIYQAAAQTDP